MLEANLSRFALPRDLKLLSIKTHKNGYLWEVEKIRQDQEICPKCAQPSRIRAGKCVSTVRDEPMRGESLWLRIHKHRYFCKSCRKPFTEPVSLVWPGRKTTQRFRKAVAKAAHHTTDLNRVRKLFNVSSGFLYRVFYEQVEVKLRERAGLHWPEVVGVDEHFFRRSKGFSEFVTVFTDIKKRRLFEVAHGKSTNQLMEQLMSIPGRLSVRLVVMDLSSGYRALAKKLFPNALIVADKFHVLRLLNPSIMKAGKQIHGHRQELKTRRLLLHNRMKLDYWVRSEVDQYLKNHGELRELYTYKEKLYSLYRIKGVKRAGRTLSTLINEMKMSELNSIKKLRNTLMRWHKEILLHFENGYTNAFTETMNRIGKLVQRRGCGYKSFKNYRLRVLSACIF